MQGAAEALSKLKPEARGGAVARAMEDARQALTRTPYPAPASAPTRSVRAEALIPARISDLVHGAAERQAEHVRSQRAPAGTAQNSTATAASGADSLAEALARIEAAAAGARLTPRDRRSTRGPEDSEESQD